MRLIREGATGTAAGATVGITRERVRQIWKRETGTPLPTWARSRKRNSAPRTCRRCGALVARGKGQEHHRSAVVAHRTARFWAQVRRGFRDQCWEWLGKKYPTGYGQHNFGAASNLAHRFAYEIAKGAIPTGLTIDHLCRNRGCVNPAHLEAVPLGVNVLRGNGMGARNARKTHCIRGHEFTPENTRTRTQARGTSRACRTCGAIRAKGGFTRVNPCIRGHLPTAENVSPSGGCRPCNRIATLAYQARKRAAA